MEPHLWLETFTTWYNIIFSVSGHPILRLIFWTSDGGYEEKRIKPKRQSKKEPWDLLHHEEEHWCIISLLCLQAYLHADKTEVGRETGQLKCPVFDSHYSQCLSLLKCPWARTQTFIFSEAPAGETSVFVVTCFGWHSSRGVPLLQSRALSS